MRYLDGFSIDYVALVGVSGLWDFGTSFSCSHLDLDSVLSLPIDLSTFRHCVELHEYIYCTRISKLKLFLGVGDFPGLFF
jgi:hypothetical protein